MCLPNINKVMTSCASWLAHTNPIKTHQQYMYIGVGKVPDETEGGRKQDSKITMTNL